MRKDDLLGLASVDALVGLVEQGFEFLVGDGTTPFVLRLLYRVFRKRFNHYSA